MRLHQLRNATIVIETGGHRILVDPMLARKHALPPLRVFGSRERNPRVELPAGSDTLLDSVTHALITHCRKGHFDHLDSAARAWLRQRAIPIYCTPEDAAYLQSKGLAAVALAEDNHLPHPFLGGTLRTVPCLHGRGLVGKFMMHGVGYFIEMPGEPSLYISGDTVLTDTVRDFVRTHRPDILVVPAGGARMDIGSEIIMGVDEVVALCKDAGDGIVVANHLEALSHCPETRQGLAEAARRAGLGARLRIPADGDTLTFAPKAA